MIQLTLDPIVPFLVIKPLLGQRVRSKSAATTLKKVDHREGVVALWAFDPQPRPDTGQERLCG